MIIETLLLDSRKLHSPSTSLFFALKGSRRDGHGFIGELYKKGIRNFVVSELVGDQHLFPEANILHVMDTLVALQQLAAFHRQQFKIPVIGVTGSNGKTIVKEWLYQLLHKDFNIVRSPRSYNSQIGLPLSIWQMNETHELGIFEAGISQQGEMIRLEKVLQPTMGILTNIGEAHSEGFNDPSHKFREKLSLFKNSEIIIGREIDFEGNKEIIDFLGDDLIVMTWGLSSQNQIIVGSVNKSTAQTTIQLHHDGNESEIVIPFTDDASIENAITCFCVLLKMNMEPGEIARRMKNLHAVNMRLEMKKGINHCLVINDSYSADLSSLEIALNFLDQQSLHSGRTVILSDFLQSALADEELYSRIYASVQQHQINRLIGIGERISAGIQPFMLNPDVALKIELYPSTADFMNQFRSSAFKDETILVKGARIFAFEQIVKLLEQKVHQTVLEINLNAIAHNLKEYQNILKPATKIMAMVKAFAYGSGGAEIAGILQYHKADYLGVAYADEGVELRKAGIMLPIMVMNPEESAFETIVENSLEPELYSFELLNSFNSFLQQEGLQQYPVHIEIETGMNRLGFAVADVEKLGTAITLAPALKIQSVFTHLSASEEPGQDEFTLDQFKKFEQAVRELKARLDQPFLSHIANSAASARLPAIQMDMVRLGIGLYGVDSTNSTKLKLQPVATLKSTIAQIKHLKSGESVGYNRKTIVARDTVLATIRIGYADGYPRRLGNGVGKIWVRTQSRQDEGKLAPVIGSVCMDMIMVDVTDIAGVEEGDEVIIFGSPLSIQKLAEWAGTIPYEIMTGISQRVKRVYYEE